MNHGPDPFALLDRGRAGLDALAQGAGLRFTAAVQRSWWTRRLVNPGLLALSILRDDARRRLLEEWRNSGEETSSFFSAEADALLDFIAAQLPDPSPELAVCRFEQFTLRANIRARSFKAPLLLFDPEGIIRQGRHAGMVFFHGKPDLILSTLLQQQPPPFSLDATALLVAPGLQPLCRIAAPEERELWTRLTLPTTAAVLVRDGCPRNVIETMLRAGALEYA